eukprot:5145314-Amphidinium_carterae.1
MVYSVATVYFGFQQSVCSRCHVSMKTQPCETERVFMKPNYGRDRQAPCSIYNAHLLPSVPPTAFSGVHPLFRSSSSVLVLRCCIVRRGSKRNAEPQAVLEQQNSSWHCAFATKSQC